MPVSSTEMLSEPSAAEMFAAARETRTDESEVKKISTFPRLIPYFFLSELSPNLGRRRRPMHVGVVYAASPQSSGAYIPSNHAP